MTTAAGYVITYLREGHKKPSHLHVGAGHLVQQVRAWTTNHTGQHDHLRVRLNATTGVGLVKAGGEVLARFTVTAHAYGAPMTHDHAEPAALVRTEAEMRADNRLAKYDGNDLTQAEITIEVAADLVAEAHTALQAYRRRKRSI